VVDRVDRADIDETVRHRRLRSPGTAKPTAVCPLRTLAAACSA
jgi:hypothetical protein